MYFHSRSKTILLEIIPYVVVVACNAYMVHKLRMAQMIQRAAAAEQMEMVLKLSWLPIMTSVRTVGMG